MVDDKVENLKKLFAYLVSRKKFLENELGVQSDAALDNLIDRTLAKAKQYPVRATHQRRFKASQKKGK